MRRILTMTYVVLAAATVFAAKTWYVDDDNYNENYTTAAEYITAGYDGSTPEKAFGTIQMAIDATTTKSGDTILVCEGIYDKGVSNLVVSGTDCGACRNVAHKTVRIESIGGATKTHIVGAWDQTTESGRGANSIRCIGHYWTKPVFKGFTLRDGATMADSDAGLGRGGALYSWQGSQPGHLVDCVVSNCNSAYGTFQGGCVVRTLVCDNFALYGTGGRQTSLYSSILTRNRCPGQNLIYASYTSLAHCTVFGNEAYTAVLNATSASNNIVILSHAGGTELGGAGLSGNVLGGTDGIYQLIAPALGDFRVLKGSLADVSRVNGVDGSGLVRPVPEEFLGRDFYGKPIPAENACAGAVQEVVEAAGGALQFDNISSTAGVTVNGWKSIKPGAYLFPTNYPEQYLVGPALVTGKIYAWSTADGHGSFHLPDWKTDSLYLMPPPQTDVVMTNTLRLATGEVWLDPEEGNDVSGNGTEEHPYQTLQKGREAAVTDYTFVYCKKGNYDKGGSFYWGVTNRVYIGTRAVRFVGVDGATETFITGAADSNSPVEEQPGCGSAAIRAIASGSCTSGFEGFTFRNCHSAAQQEGEGAAVGHQGCVMRTTGSAVTIMDCVVEANCGAAANAFTGGRLVRCFIKGLTSGIPTYSDVTLTGCLVENCKSSEYWPSGHGFHCTLRNSGTLAWNYACIGSGGARIRTSNAAKFAGSVMHNYTTYEAGTTGYVTDDPLFASLTGPSVRRCSPAFTCGEVPTAENYGAEYYKYVSTDFYGRPLTFVNGKPVAGADQLGVFEIFAKKRFTATKATTDVTESANGVISVPQGGSMTVVAPAGALNRRGGLVLMMSVPADGSLSLAVNGVTYDFGAGTHSLKLPSGASATELRFTGIAETSTLLALNSGAGFALSFR